MLCGRKRTKYYRCKVCMQAIKGNTFKTRMKNIRRHYKQRHPSIWRKAILRGVHKRKRG